MKFVELPTRDAFGNDRTTYVNPQHVVRIVDNSDRFADQCTVICHEASPFTAKMSPQDVINSLLAVDTEIVYETLYRRKCDERNSEIESLKEQLKDRTRELHATQEKLRQREWSLGNIRKAYAELKVRDVNRHFMEMEKIRAEAK